MKNPHYAIPGTRGVYAVLDPRSGDVAYVGSSENIEARFVQHRTGQGTSGKRAERRAWVADLRAAGLEPLLRVLEQIPTGDMRPAEGWWIAFYRGDGQARFNTHTNVGAETKRDLRAKITALEARVAELEHNSGRKA
jgi:hypothetical protein